MSSNDSPSSNQQQSSDSSNDTMPPLKVDPSRATALLENLLSIHTRISNTCRTHSIPHPPRLVAVSKLKPATDILALHQPPPSNSLSSSQEDLSTVQPHLHFGENYVQELLQKSKLLPPSVRWHFIGGLQSNKCQQLARDVPNLWAVESVDSEKKARLLDKGRGQSENSDGSEQLRVFVQLNTSGEESKSGVEPKSKELLALCRLVRDECEHLHLQGLMTIGAIARSQATTAETENEDFIVLRENRDWVADELGVQREELELSMGMSEDFEGAIVQGSNEVRVGSTIFGERPPKSEAKVLEGVEEGKK